jgi:hypothetical protein
LLIVAEEQAGVAPHAPLVVRVAWLILAFLPDRDAMPIHAPQGLALVAARFARDARTPVEIAARAA